MRQFKFHKFNTSDFGTVADSSLEENEDSKSNDGEMSEQIDDIIESDDATNVSVTEDSSSGSPSLFQKHRKRVVMVFSMLVFFIIAFSTCFY